MRVGFGLGLGDTGEPVKGHDIVAIGGPVAVVLLALAQIIIAVGHAEPGLAGGGGVAGGIGGIGQDADADRRGIARSREQAKQLVAIAHRGDPVEPRAGGGDAARLDPRLVHPARVEIADLAAGRIAAAAFDDRLELPVDILAEHGPQAPGRAVAGDRIALEPAVVGVAVEIVAGLDGEVAAVEVDSPIAVMGLAGRRRLAGGRSGGLREERRGAGEQHGNGERET